jgi:methionyl-tRNA synthetase
MFRSLMIYLSPVVPVIARDARTYLNEDTWHWQDAVTPLLGVQLPTFKPLLTRVDPERVQRMVDQSRDSTPMQD